MKILLFPGSFKPPHYGHFLVVEKLIKDYDEVFIIISAKPRALDKRFRKIEYKSLSEINSLLNMRAKTKEIALKKYNKMIKDGKIPSIKSEVSKEIWEIYKKYLPNGEKKLKIIATTAKSPLLVAFAIYEKKKDKNNITMIKSDKDISNKRFKNCDKNCKELIMKGFHDLNSSNAREEIRLDNKKKFYKFLPPKLSNNDKNKIWKLLIKSI